MDVVACTATVYLAIATSIGGHTCRWYFSVKRRHCGPLSIVRPFYLGKLDYLPLNGQVLFPLLGSLRRRATRHFSAFGCVITLCKVLVNSYKTQLVFLGKRLVPEGSMVKKLSNDMDTPLRTKYEEHFDGVFSKHTTLWLCFCLRLACYPHLYGGLKQSIPTAKTAI